MQSYSVSLSEGKVERPQNVGITPYRTLQPEGQTSAGAPHASPPTKEMQLLSALLEDKLYPSDQEEQPVRQIASVIVVPPPITVHAFSTTFYSEAN